MNKEQYRRYRHNQRVYAIGEDQTWSESATKHFSKIPFTNNDVYNGNFCRGTLVEFWRDIHDPSDNVWGRRDMEYKLGEFKHELRHRWKGR